MAESRFAAHGGNGGSLRFRLGDARSRAGPGSDETIVSQLQAVAATPAVCFVRIAANEPPRFKRVLDLGAMGVMVPYMSTPAEAQAAVAAMRYPPRGIRGVAKLTRATTFGAGFESIRARPRVAGDDDPDRDGRSGGERRAYCRDRRRRRPLHWPDGSHDEPRHLRNYEHPRTIEAFRHVAACAKAAGKAAGSSSRTPRMCPCAAISGKRSSRWGRMAARRAPVFGRRLPRCERSDGSARFRSVNS